MELQLGVQLLQEVYVAQPAKATLEILELSNCIIIVCIMFFIKWNNLKAKEGQKKLWYMLPLFHALSYQVLLRQFAKTLQ